MLGALKCHSRPLTRFQMHFCCPVLCFVHSSLNDVQYLFDVLAVADEYMLEGTLCSVRRP